MFTGIIEEIGTVERLETLTDSARLTVRGPLVSTDTPDGGSIAVNGVCLTVAGRTDDGFIADVMAETLRRTTLAELLTGDRVNLERALRADGRLDGHIVQGHVDGTATLAAIRPGQAWQEYDFEVDPALARYIAEKGSIAIDGTSLTVTAVGDDMFGVALIPATLERTVLGGLVPGHRVNIEVDVLAKYVERLLSRDAEAVR